MGRSAKFNLGILVIAGILVAAAILAVYLLTQRSQPTLQELAERNPDHYAVYSVVAEAAGTKKNATLIYAKKGENFVMAAKSDQGLNRVIVIDGKAYFCSAPVGAQWSCRPMSLEAAKQYTMKYIIKDLSDVRPLAPKLIAGEYSYCWGGILPSNTASVETKAAICMNTKGVVTRIVTETRAGGQVVQRVEVTLTKLSWSVPDSLFQLPAGPVSP